MEKRSPSILALIPARGGSKGIPRKNLLNLAGRPLIAWTIEVARKSDIFFRIIVSTDDEEIAKKSRELGAEVPFLRPKELATDHSPSIDVALHALDWLETEQACKPDLVMLLQPTSPLRSAQDIQAAALLASTKNANAVVSVSQTHQHPLWMKRITTEGLLVDWEPPSATPHRRQDLPTVYSLNGAIYLARRSFLQTFKTFMGDETYAAIMPAERSLDLDTAWDFYLADLIMRDREHHAGH